MKKSVLAATVAAAVLAAPAAAQAHVTLNPREVTAGSFTVMNVRVPNERDDAGTVKVDVRFPDGFYSVLYKKVPGWKAKVVMEKLDTPVDREGLKITEQVSRIVWTGTRGRAGSSSPASSRSSRSRRRCPRARPARSSPSGRSRPTATASASAGPARPRPTPRPRA